MHSLLFYNNTIDIFIFHTKFYDLLTYRLWLIKNCQFIKIKMVRKYLSYSQLQCVIKLSMKLNVSSNYSFILCWFVTLYWVLLFIYFLFLCGVDEKIKNGAVKMMFCLVIGLAASRKGIMWLSSINSEYKI